MRAYPILVLCGVSFGWLGCESEPGPGGSKPPDEAPTRNPPDEAPPPASKTPWASGGTTGDFGGDCALCEEPKLEPIALDDDDVLGFSTQEVLDVVEGGHVGAVRWRAACAHEACDALDPGCPREPLSFGGTETELRVEVARAGDPMLETCPARAGLAWADASVESCIGTYLHIPVRVALATADGLFGAAIDDEELFVEPGGLSLGIGGRLAPEQVDGTLASELPALSNLEWSVWFGSQGAEADLYLLGELVGVHEENLGQLVAGDTSECLVGFPLARAD